MIGAMRAESYKYHNFWKLFMRLESLLPFTKGLSSTIILSIHLLSLCTYFESIVAILSSMFIVPRLVDWFITLILLVLKLFVSSHPYKLWRCPMHLCFATLWGTSWMPLCYVFFMWNKQTSCKALLFTNLLFVPFHVTT